MALNRTQRAALADLRRVGALWPHAGGRFRPSGTGNDSHLYRRTTLDALVAAGHAKWAQNTTGVLPHVVVADEPRAPRPGRVHECEAWMLRESPNGGQVCGACGEHVDDDGEV